MTIWDHLEELRSRVLVSAGAVGALILLAFCFSKDLVLLLESPVAGAGVRFIASAPGEYFFTTIKVAGYSGLLLGAPIVLYEIVAFVVPGLTRSERSFLAPIVLGSSVLFYGGIFFSYEVLTPAALNFFVSYNEVRPASAANYKSPRKYPIWRLPRQFLTRANGLSLCPPQNFTSR